MNLSHDTGECLIGISDKLYHITQENIQEAYWMDPSHNTRKLLKDKLGVSFTQHRSMIKKHIRLICNITQENVKFHYFIDSFFSLITVNFSAANSTVSMCHFHILLCRGRWAIHWRFE